LEQVQVYTIHRLESNANEILCEPSDIFVFADNLSVEIGTGQSSFAPKDDKDWFTAVPRFLLRFLVAVKPLDRTIDRLWRHVIANTGRDDRKYSYTNQVGQG
jgi:hypothetical protein